MPKRDNDKVQEQVNVDQKYVEKDHTTTYWDLVKRVFDKHHNKRNCCDQAPLYLIGFASDNKKLVVCQFCNEKIDQYNCTENKT